MPSVVVGVSCCVAVPTSEEIVNEESYICSCRHHLHGDLLFRPVTETRSSNACSSATCRSQPCNHTRTDNPDRTRHHTSTHHDHTSLQGLPRPTAERHPEPSQSAIP